MKPKAAQVRKMKGEIAAKLRLPAELARGLRPEVLAL
jgi:hypothetical protein